MSYLKDAIKKMVADEETSENEVVDETSSEETVEDGEETTEVLEETSEETIEDEDDQEQVIEPSETEDMANFDYAINTDTKVKIKTVAGDRLVPLKDLANGFMMQSDYTRKSQKLAADRQELSKREQTHYDREMSYLEKLKKGDVTPKEEVKPPEFENEAEEAAWNERQAMKADIEEMKEFKAQNIESDKKAGELSNLNDIINHFRANHEKFGLPLEAGAQFLALMESGRNHYGNQYTVEKAWKDLIPGYQPLLNKINIDPEAYIAALEKENPKAFQKIFDKNIAKYLGQKDEVREDTATPDSNGGKPPQVGKKVKLPTTFKELRDYTEKVFSS